MRKELLRRLKSSRWTPYGLGVLSALLTALLVAAASSTGRYWQSLTVWWMLPVGGLLAGALANSGLIGWQLYLCKKPALNHRLATLGIGFLCLAAVYLSLYASSYVDYSWESKRQQAGLEALDAKASSQLEELKRVSGEIKDLKMRIFKKAGGSDEAALEHNRLMLRRKETMEEYRKALDEYNMYGLASGTFDDEEARTLRGEVDRLRKKLITQEAQLKSIGSGSSVPQEERDVFNENIRIAGEHNDLVIRYKRLLDEYEATLRDRREAAERFDGLRVRRTINNLFHGEHISAYMRWARGDAYRFRDFLGDCISRRPCRIVSAARRPPLGKQPPPPISFCGWHLFALELLGFLTGGLFCLRVLDKTYYVQAVVRCGGCGKPLRVPAWRGRIQIRCPSCGRKSRYPKD